MRYSLLMVVCGGLVLAGCQSVPTPFGGGAPDYARVNEPALRALAAEIERVVQTGNREFALDVPEGVTADSEVVRQAIRTRAARAALVNELLDKGYAVEKPNGHLYVQHSKAYKKATTRQERDRNAMVVGGEAESRWSLYEGLVEENNYPAGALNAVQAIFHDARVAAMKPGQPYVNEAGETVKAGEAR